MKQVQIRFKTHPEKAATYAVSDIEYNIIGLIQLKWPNGDVEYINLDTVFSVKEIAK